MVFVFSLLAALSNGVASVCERKAAMATADENLRGLRLVAALLRQPVWFGGFAGLVAGFLFQLVALAHGRLGIVQPLLVLELPFTLLLAALVFRRRTDRRSLAATAAMTTGLAVFLYVGDPRGGSRQPSAASWVLTLGLATGLLLAVVALAFRLHGGRRAALLSVAAGGGFALTAVLMKGATQALDGGIGGIVGLLGNWATYAMVVGGIASFYLLQRALQAGPLDVVQPGVTITDPIAAILCGALLFRDSLRPGLAVVGEVLGSLAIVYGVLILSRSPLLDDPAPSPEPVLPERADLPTGGSTSV